MIIRKSQLLIRTIIVRKQGPGGTPEKTLENGLSAKPGVHCSDSFTVEAGWCPMKNILAIHTCTQYL